MQAFLYEFLFELLDGYLKKFLKQLIKEQLCEFPGKNLTEGISKTILSRISGQIARAIGRDAWTIQEILGIFPRNSWKIFKSYFTKMILRRNKIASHGTIYEEIFERIYEGKLEKVFKCFRS